MIKNIILQKKTVNVDLPLDEKNQLEIERKFATKKVTQELFF